MTTSSQPRELTAQVLRERLSYDADGGGFVWKSCSGAAAIGSSAGTLHRRGYLNICINGRKYGAHRLAWLYVHGQWPAGEIDHINGDKVDNRIANLRDVRHATNTQNIRRPYRTNLATGLLGVRRADTVKEQYSAGLSANGRYHHLGSFATAMAAHQAYVSAKRRLHEGCTL